MPSFIRSCLAFGTLLASAAVASPIVERVPSNSDIRARDLALGIRAFLPAHTIGTYDCASSFQKDTIFSDANLEVTCIDCHTTGTALVTTSDVTKNTTLLEDFLHPLDAIADAFGIDLKVTLQDFEAYFDMELSTDIAISKTIQLLKIPTPLGVAISDDVSVGLVIYIDLVLDLSAEIDMTAGFSISFPDGAYIIVDPLTGNIVDKNFNSPDMGYLPVTVKSGSAAFTAALQVRVEIGSTVELGIIGYAFELGLYVDAIEYKATLSSTPTCKLYVTEGLDINIGAYAEAVVEIDYTTFGVSPTAKTTIWTAALPSICSNPTSTISSASVTTTVLPDEPITLTSTKSSSASVKTTVLPNEPITRSTTSKSATTTSSSSSSFQTAWSNGTISAAQLTTSTVYATDVITVTKCPATITNCPASQKTIEVVTSTKILYTTICPVGQVLPTTIPSKSKSMSLPKTKSTITMVPFKPSSCATPIISTVYTPTVAAPTYAIQTLTGHAPAFPLWNATIYTIIYVGASSSPVAVGSPSSTITYTAVETATIVVPQSGGTVGIAIATRASSGNATNVKVAATPSTSVYTAGVARTGGSLIAAFVAVLHLALL